MVYPDTLVKSGGLDEYDAPILFFVSPWSARNSNFIMKPTVYSKNSEVKNIRQYAVDRCDIRYNI